MLLVLRNELEWQGLSHLADEQFTASLVPTIERDDNRPELKHFARWLEAYRETQLPSWRPSRPFRPRITRQTKHSIHPELVHGATAIQQLEVRNETVTFVCTQSVNGCVKPESHGNLENVLCAKRLEQLAFSAEFPAERSFESLRWCGGIQ